MRIEFEATRLLKFYFLIFILIAAQFFSSSSFSNKTNRKNTLIGGRNATMGGAYTAIADDATGVFANPAGLVYSPALSMSGSANMLQSTQQEYDGVVGGNDWKRKSESLQPNFFGIVKKWGKGHLAFVYALTDVTQENQNELFQGLDLGAGTLNNYQLVLNTDDKTYHGAIAYARPINKKASWGLTLDYMYRRRIRIQDEFEEYDGGTYKHTFQLNDVRSQFVRPILGLMFATGKKWSMGLTVGKAFNFARLEEDVKNRKPQVSATQYFLRQTDRTTLDTPYEIQLGFAYFKNPYTVFSMNLDGFIETQDGKENIYNLSLGFEHFTSDQWAWRFGLFSNRTNVPEFNSSVRSTDERVDVYGVTAGRGYYSKGTQVTLGLSYEYGKGELQPFEGLTNEHGFTLRRIALVLASSYEF